jgi:signal transduction histidine kinase
VRLDWLTKQVWLVAIGVALAAGGICLAFFRPRPVEALFVPLPAIYAATLAGFAFWFRARLAAGRERMFCLLWAAGCWLWTAAGTLSFFTRGAPGLSNVQLFRLTFTFLPQILFMAALVMQPEIRAGQLRDRVVQYEAALVALWWAYLYALLLGPWHWLAPNRAKYLYYFGRLHDFQNGSAVVWLFGLWLASKGPWRRIYAHLAGAVGLLALSTGLFFRAWIGQRWLPTMIFQALLASAFLWMSHSPRILTAAQPDASAPRQEPTLGAGVWLASITAIGIPALAAWSSVVSVAPGPIRRFRLFLSFATFLAAMLLLYRWQDVAECERERLVADLETSVRELRQLQSQFAEAEKLASLGQLAAGAAHEINNPVAAMLGYSELLRSEPSASERLHEFGRKIGDQARRIRNLVNNLLSLTEHENRESKPIDIARPLRGAIELHRISGGHRRHDLSLAVDTEGDLALEARADPEKLLQVFYRLLLALSEVNRETKIEVRARGDSANGRVAIEFVGRPAPDSVSAHPNVYDAQRAQQGMELSLNVCYMIVKELGGALVHENAIDGGKMFRVELPAADAAREVPSAVS